MDVSVDVIMDLIKVGGVGVVSSEGMMLLGVVGELVLYCEDFV